MFSTATKIYLLTNVIFIVGISLAAPGLGLLAAPFSLLFTAPLILLISALLWALKKLKTGPIVGWLLFFAGIASMTYLPFYVFTPADDLIALLPIAYVGAFTSVLLLYKSIHRHFLPNPAIKTNVKREAWSN